MIAIRRILVFFLVFCGLFSCRSQNKKALSYDGFPLEVTDDYTKAEYIELMDVPYYNYHLKKSKVVQSYPIKGSFRVNPEGELYGFTLSENHVINGTMIPAESSYQRYGEDFYFIALSKDTIIQGFPVFYKEDGFIFWTENNVEFFNDGTIMGFGLSEDMVIRNIPCNASKNYRTVQLFKNGELKHCNLSKNIEIQGFPCRGGDENSELWFNSDGQLISFILSQDLSIDGKLYAPGTQIIFDKNQKVHYLSGQLHYVHFYDNGQICNCVLENDTEINGKLIVKKSRILFYEDGSLWQIRPKKAMIIDGIPCKENRFLGFYPDGKIKWCNLSKDFEINGKIYKKGEWLDFDEEGKVL